MADWNLRLGTDEILLASSIFRASYVGATRVMFDQVLIRPELLDRFQMDGLAIIDHNGAESLLTNGGRPEREDRIGPPANPLSTSLQVSKMIDLWPKDLRTTTMTTPVTILREQASLLGVKTRNIVRAEVRS